MSNVEFFSQLKFAVSAQFPRSSLLLRIYLLTNVNYACTGPTLPKALRSSVMVQDGLGGVILFGGRLGSTLFRFYFDDPLYSDFISMIHFIQILFRWSTLFRFYFDDSLYSDFISMFQFIQILFRWFALFSENLAAKKNQRYEKYTIWQPCPTSGWPD
jgi:hypothetical protein